MLFDTNALAVREAAGRADVETSGKVSAETEIREQK
jgi:hypothetical protein